MCNWNNEPSTRRWGDKFIRFFVENLGAQFYIQGVIDSYKYIVEKSDDLLSLER